jgi:hypothetical protein
VACASEGYLAVTSWTGDEVERSELRTWVDTDQASGERRVVT